jgi:hemerythrin-like domain-containing protein
MATVFEVLMKDHEEVRRMLAELETGPTMASGASEAELLLRKRMTEQLIIEESRHEAVEEMYFWPAVRDRVPDGDWLADEATVQEQEAKAVLNRLDKLDASDADFEEMLGMFTTAAREHIEFEENRAWPGLRSRLTAAEAEDLGGLIIDAKKAAPTRPHPGTPGTPGVQKATGPAAGLIDKIRDAVTGRGGD